MSDFSPITTQQAVEEIEGHVNDLFEIATRLEVSGLPCSTRLTAAADDILTVIDPLYRRIETGADEHEANGGASEETP